MPIYEYQCAGCGHTFEYFSFSADGAGPESCPSCGGKETSRVISPFSCGGGCGSGSGRAFS